MLPALSDIVVNTASNGSLQIPNSTGNDLIVNWGVTASISNTALTVNYDTNFPNAAFVGFAIRNTGAGNESAAHVQNLGLTSVDVVNSGGTSSVMYWITIGY